MEGFSRLVGIVETLRSERGCPWDRKQDLKAFKTFLLEEVYELIDAIEREDSQSIKEELGDLILHVVFISQIMREKGSFDVGEVLQDVCEKMIRRHPHVFKGEKLSKDVPRRWEEIKREEKGASKGTLSGVPKNLPALVRAYIVTKKASRVGFDWKDPKEVIEKIEEELDELKGAKDLEDKERMREEIGDILFSVVNLSRFLGVDPEDALRKTIDKFIQRFSYIESKIDVTKANLEELDRLWEESKRLEEKGD